jgi:hypothetical protein
MPLRILIAACDAGGAEVVSSWVRKNPEHRYLLMPEGPALKIFENKLGPVIPLSRTAIESATAESDLALTGTGSSTDIGRLVIREARAQKKKVAAYLDHWTYYRERFLDAGELVLPDEIWVGDEHALKIAKETFERCVIRLEPNRYLEELTEEIRRLTAIEVRDDRRKRILFVCEPISNAMEKTFGDPLRHGYTEFEAMDGYFEYLKTQAAGISEVRIRRHPAEPKDKYLETTQRYAGCLPIKIGGGQSLAEDCAWADVVVGCESMALVVAHLAGKTACSCIPARIGRFSLPYPEIRRIFHSTVERR